MKKIHIVIFVLFAWTEVAIFHAFMPSIDYDLVKRNALELQDNKPCVPCPEHHSSPTQQSSSSTNSINAPPQSKKDPTTAEANNNNNNNNNKTPAKKPTPPPVLAQMDKKTASELEKKVALTPEQLAERDKKRKAEMALVHVLPKADLTTNPKKITLPSVSAPAVDPNPKSKAAIVQRNYDEDLRKAAARYKQYSTDWATDPKYSCFKHADLPCRTLPNLPANLPANFRNACEPIFALVGTPKSGTTSFYYYIIQHPQVNQALSGNYNKEVRYFAEFFNKGPGWYIQQFPPITPNDISFPDDPVPRVHMANGEASPTYFFNADAPARIKTVTPNMKLIALMADPVKRAYSEKMMYDNNRQSPYRRNLYDDVKYQIDTFNKCWQKYLKEDANYDQTDLYFKCLTQKEFTGRLTPPYVLHSVYVHQVRNYLRYFPREQILFLKSEDLRDNTRGTMDKITDFIGLCRFDWGNITDTLYNKRPKVYNPIPADVQTLMTDFYRNYTYQFYSEVGEDWDWPSA